MGPRAHAEALASDRRKDTSIHLVKLAERAMGLYEYKRLGRLWGRKSRELCPHHVHFAL